MKCPNCQAATFVSLATSHEPEGIRKDRACSVCHKMYMITKSHPVEILFTDDELRQHAFDAHRTRTSPDNPYNQSCACGLVTHTPAPILCQILARRRIIRGQTYNGNL